MIRGKAVEFWSVMAVLMLAGGTSDAQYIKDNGAVLGLWRFSRGLLFNIAGNSGAQTSRLGSRLQRPWPKDAAFPCDVTDGKSPTRPNSVHMLRPGDVDVVAGLGDSLMCNNGAAATNPLHVLRENRGLAWAAGGQGTWREFTTFPNILKVYNPALQGYAVGDGYTTHNNSRLNLGEPGALSEDMLYSAQVLAKRLDADPNIDLQKHWKVISIMIGANDICSHICYSKNPESYPDRHRQNLIKALRFIKNNIPRSFVNLVPLPPIDQLIDMRHQPSECWAAHILECTCLFSDRFRRKRKKFIEILRRWVDVESEVSQMKEFQDKEDFAAVYQPFAEKLLIPKDAQGRTDLTYLSVDCFHLSQKSNALAGVALFRSMLQPVGQKDKNWKDYDDDFPCPSKKDPYFKTHLNSNNSL